jgi:hypothetical protein
MWLPKFLKKQRPQPKPHYNWTPMTDAFGDLVRIDKPQKVGGTVVARVRNDSDAFRSTAASQWSTAGVCESRNNRFAKLFTNPLRVQRNADGRISSIAISRSDLQEQFTYVKWLAHHPELIHSIIRQARRRNERLADSALFL